MGLEPGIVDESQIARPEFHPSPHPEAVIHGERHGPRATTLDSEQDLR